MHLSFLYTFIYYINTSSRYSPTPQHEKCDTNPAPLYLRLYCDNANETKFIKSKSQYSDEIDDQSEYKHSTAAALRHSQCLGSRKHQQDAKQAVKATADVQWCLGFCLCRRYIMFLLAFIFFLRMHIIQLRKKIL